MIDYLIDRGNISFSGAPFNEVDNLILSTIVYGDFRGFVPGLGAKPSSIREVRDGYYAYYPKRRIEVGRGCTYNAPAVLDFLAECRRFGNTRLRDFIDILNPDEHMQLAAMTYELEDGSIFVAFRGTDSTLVGWRGGFNFSFMTRTTGQATAVEYLNRVMKSTTGPVRVGGHSKGGHFAVYASAFCDPAYRSRIVKVYSNDGPGVNETVAASKEYRAVLPKVIKFIPEESIVGLLLSGQGEFEIIRSSRKGIMQHDPTSWEVVGDHFAQAMSRSHSTVALDRVIKNWVAGLSPQERKRFIDSLFNVLELSGAETISDLKENGLSAAAGMVVAMASLPPEDQKGLWEIIASLADSGKQEIFSGLAFSQVAAAAKITKTVTDIAQAGVKLVQDITGVPGKVASELFSENSSLKEKHPKIPSLLDERIMNDEIRALMDKYDKM